jgi:thymidylate kinase
MLIAFMGNDGSGKTTLAKEICKFFQELGFDTFYKHEYEYVLLKQFFKLIGEKHLEKSRKEMIVEKKKFWKYRIWPILVWIDVYLQFLYFKVFNRRTIILLDRYIYDHYMSFEYLGYLSRFTTWLYRHFPKPDIPLLFWVEPEVAYKRKKDTHRYSISFYQKQLKRYLEMGNELGIPMVNTEKDIEETKKTILKQFFQNKQFTEIFLKHCSKNRILSWVIEEYKLDLVSEEIGKVKQHLDALESKAAKTLEFINNIPIDKLIFKTYMDLKWIPFNDIDLLIPEKDIEGFLDHIRWKGGRVSSTEPEKFDCQVEGLLKIEPHLTLTWRGMNYIDPNFLWRHPRNVEMLNIPVNVPSYEADLLSHVAQIIYENSFMRFNEYRYIRYLLSKILNIKLVFEQAKKYGWEVPFKDLMSLIENSSTKKIHFPYFLPYTTVLRNYWFKVRHDIKTKEFNVQELRTCIRDLFIFLFWRIRYMVKGEIPFDMILNVNNNGVGN